jgi:hypothetical protein
MPDQPDLSQRYIAPDLNYALLLFGKGLRVLQVYHLPALLSSDVQEKTTSGPSAHICKAKYSSERMQLLRFLKDL